jgi:hypothetical protein
MNVMERLQKDIEKADPEYGQQMRDARSIVIDQTDKEVFKGTVEECFNFALKANTFLDAHLSVKKDSI